MCFFAHSWKGRTMALHRPITSPPATVSPVPATLPQWAAPFDRVHVDLGTGDGAYALRVARMHPDHAVIGLDTMLDHLRGARKRHPRNVRFDQADALAWPLGTLPGADLVTINFPYGSLLRGLVEGDPALLQRLDALLGPGSRLAIRVNRSALVATGLDPLTGPDRITATVSQLDGVRVATCTLDRDDLRAFPSSWAKRLGYGRETGAVLVEAVRRGG
jgi:16S rRNA (adenine(1408)-N(1))-methyltransferase